MSNFYRQIASELTKQPIVLATVIQTSGSVPGRVGSKMFVCTNKQSVGTIGGGIGEAQIYAKALQTLTSGINSFVDINLSETCGGQMRIWLERWDKKLLPLVQQILMALETGNPATIVTPFDQVPYLIPESVNTPQLTTLGCFIEPLESMPSLLIVGAGQIGVLLAQMAHLAEFQVMVLDDRPELTLPARFPHAICLTTSIESALQALPQARSRYAALITRGIEQDVATLRSLLTYSMQYIGMIGSRNRSQQVFQALMQHGHNMNQLATIHTPIGIEIGAQTPAEIAVSICAELIQIRRSGKAQTLREAKLMLD
ncbi:XdhC family protein [Cyanobacteria bacterium FACHB-63]|nr:XdhC family protein [Cyanobacteria bacterium FACHB-63]